MKISMFFMVLALQVVQATNLPASAKDFRSGNQTIKITRVRGWEAQLVAGAPNLANFYWEPMTRKTVFTTKRTGKQSNHIPLPISTRIPVSASSKRATATDLKYRVSNDKNLTCVALPLVYGKSEIPTVQELTYVDRQVTPTLRKLTVKANLAEHSSQATGLVAHAQSLDFCNLQK